MGICNGFQILCEAGLLPGVLIRNNSLHFRCETVPVRVENADSRFTRGLKAGQVLRIPIAHGEGNYVADEKTLDALFANQQVLFTYSDAQGGAGDGVEPERLGAAHRRHHESRGQRAGPDAAPGAGLGSDPRQRGRPGDFRVGAGGRGCGALMDADAMANEADAFHGRHSVVDPDHPRPAGDSGGGFGEVVWRRRPND